MPAHAPEVDALGDWRMDLGSLFGALVTLTLAGIGGLAWLFKLHGDVRVLRSDLKGEVELRKALESRFGGFEQRVYEQLETIISKLDRKADR
jgi:ABC-type transport system involved in cytochrome c biogenesis permease subunit